uniref:Centromere protein I n=1 Tax=Phasianus colchicus TaxID=9054 RepID=A0A669Q7V2_PHACC
SEKMQRRQSSKHSKRPLQVHHSNQTDLSAWRKGETVDTGKSAQSHRSLSDQKNDNEQDSLEQALSYFEKIQDRVSLKKSEVLQKHLSTLESIALKRGLPPEGFDVLLDVALSGKLVNTRLLKSLIPASAIPESSVVSSVSWFCVSKCSSNIQLLFLRWLITMFDFIDQKEQVHALYGIFFFFLNDEKLCPYICHVLYLLTRKENGESPHLCEMKYHFGMQPHLQALLSLYKLFCPELVSITLPQKMKAYFKNADGPWKAAISAVRQRNQANSTVPQPLLLGTAQPHSRKRKWNTQLIVPASSANAQNLVVGGKMSRVDSFSANRSFPVEQLRTFPQLLQNIHRLEFPSQMGSVLTNPLLLHYMNCSKDESAYLRLYYWMGQTLQEECTWCVVDNNQHEEEFKGFLETAYKAECFLQEGFPSCEEFLYRSLPLWDGVSCRSQILQLISWIPLSTFSEMKSQLCDPLAQLFFTSSLYFKCSVLESLKELLQNWLNWHVVQLDSESDSQLSSLNTTLSGLVSGVAELINFVGRISTAALHLEKSHTFLLHFILDFYETVCDIYLKYKLPLLIMPPAGVFYPALLSMDSVNLNQLCYIMYRYYKWCGLSQTYQEYNQYIIAMVGCLWTSSAFQKDNHPQGICLDDELLKKTGVEEYKNSFNIVYHPALMCYAVDFLQQGKKWNWYLRYLYGQGLEGLKLFIESSINRVSKASQSKEDKKV